MSLLEKATLITTPTAHSNGTLHSIKGGAIADFDVVRGSAATRVNAEGLIEDISILSGELVTNGDFSNGSTNWTLGIGWSVSDGKAVIDGTINSRLFQDAVTTIGKTYKYSFDVLGSGVGVIDGRFRNGGGVILSFSSEGTYTGTFVAYNTLAGFTTLSGNTASFSIDNISVVEVIDATNIPRIDYTTGEGVVLLEPQSTNLVVNSELNNVENIVVSAVSHTISFYGAGSITLSGAHTATLSGTGANDRVSLTFTPSAGTLTCTDSGGVDKKQVEALSYPTSYIPTSGAIASRLADSVTGAGDVNTFNSTEGVIYFEGSFSENTSNQQLSLSNGTTSERIVLEVRNSGQLLRFNVRSGDVNSVEIDQPITANTSYKLGLLWSGGVAKFYLNGNLVGSDSSVTPPIGINTMSFNGGASSFPFYGKVKALAVFNEALTDAELLCLTTI